MVLRKLIHQNESSKIRFNFFSLVKSTNFEKVGTNFTLILKVLEIEDEPTNDLYVYLIILLQRFKNFLTQFIS